MDKEEIIRRLKKISGYAVHVVGEPPFIMSLDDGIALDEAVRLLKEQEAKTVLNAGRQAVGNNKVFYGNCPNCQRRLYAKTSNYCQYCGQAVKWE